MEKCLRYCIRHHGITLTIGHTPVFKEFTASKFTEKYKGSKIANTVLKNNETQRLLLPDVNSWYKATAVGPVWYWLMDKHIETNGMEENSEKDRIYVNGFSTNTFKKELPKMTIQWVKEPFQEMLLEQLDNHNHREASLYLLHII